jgi:hypothetical protein
MSGNATDALLMEDCKPLFRDVNFMKLSCIFLRNHKITVMKFGIHAVQFHVPVNLRL